MRVGIFRRLFSGFTFAARSSENFKTEITWHVARYVVKWEFLEFH